jgi:hypothetical protein
MNGMTLTQSDWSTQQRSFWAGERSSCPGGAPGLPAAPASCQMNALGGAPGLPAAPASCQMNAQAKDVETGFWTPTNSDSEEDELVLSMTHRTVPLYGHNGMDAPSILQRLFEQGVHDFHELKIPGLSDQLLLLERRNPADDAFSSPAQPLSKDCLWYIQSTVPCRVTRFPPPGTDAGMTYSARMWVPVGFVQVSEECARVGDVVVYSSDTAWYGLAGGNHIGRLVSREPDMVVSKFTHGHIYMHPIGLVPHAYGPHIAFYQQARVQSLLAAK